MGFIDLVMLTARVAELAQKVLDFDFACVSPAEGAFFQRESKKLE